MIVHHVSVVICTYNRAALLRETLAALQELDPPHDCAVEILVVDNNSTDDTPRVIGDACAAGPFPVRALHEPAQGKSFALNTALGAARGDVLALTDDDVRPARDWLCRIVEVFRARDVTFTFGKVLPRWSVTPPPELLTRPAQDIWGPLALIDYGDEPADYRADLTGQRLPIGANLAFARTAIEAVGGWRTDLGRVDNTLTSGEDHEIFCRLRRFGLYAGYYDPGSSVRHYVPPGRLTRTYFRQWFFWSGRTHALMLQDVYSDIDMTRVARIGGMPRFLWRQAFEQWGRWLRSLRVGAPALETLTEELRSLQFLGLIAGCWRLRHLRRATAGSPPAVTAGG
ncbi:MAG: glycosyltransferase family 2 protein [Vicinamibacterales bacterium]